jgi:hypothetical protein
MKTKSWKTLVGIVCAIWSLSWALPATCAAQSSGTPQAVVEALKGTATMTVDHDEEPVTLASGSVVNAWNMVNTDESSKLLLNWNTGILNSLGQFTSVFLTSNETERGPLDSIEMTEGILRVNNPGSGRPMPPYMVATPVAQIEPVKLDDPVDFIVEVNDPGTTVVTVISGQVRVRNISLKQPTETVVSACQNVYVDKGKAALDMAALTADDLAGLVEASTIPGSIATTYMCPTPTAQLPSPPPPPSPSYVPSYAYEDWESSDIYPFDEITVAPPRPGIGCVVVLPWIGQWIIPADVFAGWRFDPVIVGIYCRHIVLDHIMHCDRYYLTDMRLRRKQLHHMVYLAQLSGNTQMLMEAQRKLADINVRSHWASMRLKRLEGKMSLLEKEQHKFSHKMPQGKGVFQAVSHSFNSPKNLAVARDFRNRVNADLGIQSQLARMTGKEVNDLRSRIAREKDPRQRMALREELAKVNQQVGRGKIPIPAKDTELKQVVDRLVKERDPKKLQEVEKQFNRVAKIDMPHTSELLSQAKLTSLKQDLAKYPDAKKRQELERQVNQLQRSVEARTTAEQNIRKIDTISSEAAREQDPRRRSELLGQLKSLAQPGVPAAGPAAGLNLLGQRQLLETQISLEKDKQQRATLEKTLEDQRKLQSDLIRQHQERQRQAEPGQRRQEELRKQTDQKVPEQGLPKPGGHIMPLQPGGVDLQKQQSEQLRRQQEEADKLRRQKEQSDRMKLQQEQMDKSRQKEQVDQLRRQQEESDKLRRQKEQSDRMKLQQEQMDKSRQKEQVEQLRRQQEESDKLRRQKEQSDRMKLQQEQMDKSRQKEQVEQLRRQQEESDKLRRQKEQSDRMKLQQEQTERTRQKEQSDQLRRQQEQVERARSQQQQADQLRRQQEQAERARHQQEQAERARSQQNRQQEDDVKRRFQPR